MLWLVCARMGETGRDFLPAHATRSKAWKIKQPAIVAGQTHKPAQIPSNKIIRASWCDGSTDVRRCSGTMTGCSPHSCASLGAVPKPSSCLILSKVPGSATCAGRPCASRVCCTPQLKR